MFERLRWVGRGNASPGANARGGKKVRSEREATLLWLHWRERDGVAAHQHKTLLATELARPRVWTNHKPLRQIREKYALGAARPSQAITGAPHANPCLSGPDVAHDQPPKGDTSWEFFMHG